MVMEVRLLHFKKAHDSILVTLLGIVIEERMFMSEKANASMLVTLFGIIVIEHPAIKELLLVSIIALQSFRESYWLLPSATIIEVRPLHAAKAPDSILVMLLGMVIEVRLLQP